MYKTTLNKEFFFSLTWYTFPLVFSRCWGYGSSYRGFRLSGQIWDALRGLSASSPASADAALVDSP